jgi:hypothetical protein
VEVGDENLRISTHGSICRPPTRGYRWGNHVAGGRDSGGLGVMLRRFFVKDAKRAMTYEEIAEYTQSTKGAVQKRIARRGFPKEFYVRELQGIGETVIKNDSVHIIDVELRGNKYRKMTPGMIAKELTRITKKKYDGSNIRKKWLRRGAPKQIHIMDFIEGKEYSRRYYHNRTIRRTPDKKFPPLTAADAPGIRKLASVIFNDAILVYLDTDLESKKGKAERKAKRDLEDATKFLFIPDHSMRTFWKSCLYVDDLEFDKKHFDTNKDEILERARIFDARR